MDLYTFGPLQQQHTHKNVESCGGGHCCLFWLGSKKKQNQPTTKANRNHQNGEEKNEKRKIWGSDLGPVRKSD
jgi:hypothetical protein